MTIELVGTFPLLILGFAICVQAALLGLTMVFAQVAAGQLARSPQLVAADLPVPATWRSGAQISRRGDRLEVQLQSPSVLPGVAPSRLRVGASTEAWS